MLDVNQIALKLLSLVPVCVFKMPLTSNPSYPLLGLLNICRMLNCGLGVVGSQQCRKDVLPQDEARVT